MAPLFRRLLLLTTTLALTGCSTSSPPSTGDAGSDVPVDSGSSSDPDAGAPDAGTDTVPWDGGAEALPERTDHVDLGPFSDCAFKLAVGDAVTACDDASLFDRSTCPAGAFDDLDSTGFYYLDARPSTGSSALSGYLLRLPLEGGPGTLSSRPLTRQEVGAGSFFTASTLPATRFSPARDLVFMGCTRPTPDRINGCYAQCSQGKVGLVGTFTAARPGIRARGEAESSGLTLVSESSVPLGMPVDVYVTKGHAYVVSIGVLVGTVGKPGGLSVLDVRDPSHPVLTKTIQVPGDTYWNGVWAKDDALYIASASSGVIVYDISSPADPRYVRAVPNDPLDVHTVFVKGDRLYAMAPSPGDAVLILDVSSPLAPVELNRVSLGVGGSGPHDAFVYEDRLYVSYTEAGYQAFDVTDAEHVQPLGGYFFDGQYAHASAVGTFAGRTLAFEGGEYAGSHLRVLDVTDPANMKLIGEYGLRQETSIHNMILQGTKLYVAYYQEGVRVLDVSFPPKPREVAYFNTFRETDPGRTGSTFEGAIGIRVPGDGFIYVVDTSRGLLVLSEQP
ncbi:LVIVD repeat-containing protein [Corallococcus exercitus]|uniref:LVIVD repeat-containing protein n=1 Tax=Corallococcus exercitus TaxID=2316736 RepID=UPI0035D45A80